MFSLYKQIFEHKWYLIQIKLNNITHVQECQVFKFKKEIFLF